MIKLSQNDLLSQIKANKILSYYIFYGEDIYMQEYFVAKLTQLILGSDISDFNLCKLDGEKFIIDDLLFNYNSYPLSGKKLIIIKNLDINKLNKADLKTLCEILLGENNFCHIIIYSTKELPKLKTKPLLAISNNMAGMCEFATKSESELSNIIVSFCSKRQVKISVSTAKTIALYCSFDMPTIINEITKLCFFVEDGYIDDKTVELMVVKSTEVSIYQITKDIDAKRTQDALKTLYSLLNNFVEPVYILGVISGVYYDLYVAKLASMYGKRESDIVEDFGYAKNTVFKVSSALRKSHTIPLKTIEKYLSILIQADFLLKSSTKPAKDILSDIIIALSVRG